MSHKSVYKASVDNNGKIDRIWNKHFMDADLRDHAGKQIRIEITRWRKPRSNRQNNYYWGCLIPQIIDGLIENGYNRNELDSELVHEFLKQKFLKKEIISEEGEILIFTESTQKLSTVDMMAYIEDIAQWAAEFLRIVVAMPNEQSEINY